MRIQNSNLNLNAKHTLEKKSSVKENLEMWSDRGCH